MNEYISFKYKPEFLFSNARGGVWIDWMHTIKNQNVPAFRKGKSWRARIDFFKNSFSIFNSIYLNPIYANLFVIYRNTSNHIEITSLHYSRLQTPMWTRSLWPSALRMFDVDKDCCCCPLVIFDFFFLVG